MQPGRASLTAERVAERRAAHQIIDVPRVFEDPLALRVIAPDAAQRMTDGRQPPRAFDRYLRAFVAVRSRIAEDQLRASVARGVRQYVILGAGLDTFAYRNPYPDLRVIEIDHPDTQAWKRERLAAANIAVPDSLTFVAADLARVPLGEALAMARIDTATPIFCAWLGVMMYLDPMDVRRTLAVLGSRPAGSGLTLDFAVPPSSLSLVGRFFYTRTLRRVAAIGEPWKTFLEPAAMLGELQRAGFRDAAVLTPDEINRRYFSERTDGLRVSPVGHIATATV
jgi:methyltransferase (TIGR00027 family)